MTVSGELRVAKVRDVGNELARLCNMSCGEPNRFQGYCKLIKTLRIFVMPRSRNPCRTSAKVIAGGFVEEVGVLLFSWRCSCDEVVENVKAALAGRHGSHKVLLKAIVEPFDTAAIHGLRTAARCTFRREMHSG